MTDLESRIAHTLARKDYVPAKAPEILRLLRLSSDQLQRLEEVLRTLERSGRVARIKDDRFILPLEADLVPGRIRMNRQGKGFLQPDDPGLPEIAIPESATSTALHEDRVLVRREVRAQGLRRSTAAAQPDTGAVVRILERRRTQIVGTLQRGRQFLYVVPDDPRIPHDFYVLEPRDLGRPARLGDKVVVELKEWESRHTNPEGEIVEILGAADAEGVDMLSVLRQYQLPLQFPKPVLQEARAWGTSVAPRELSDRLDCRAHRVITIDPDDAKDFDDAICLERASKDTWTLWVHIADVSHYVKPGTALDEEARKRGNSTYLVDRVIPMLPEALSNELCSLKPGVDRLTKCVEMLVSDDGRVLSTKFHAAVIHSQRRFSYAEALEVLQRTPVGPIEEMLHEANTLAQRIRRLRFKAGSLDLDFPETKIRLDEQGRILRIEKHLNDISHQLIEEFMLLANEASASRLMGLRQPALYRVHEVPDERRLQEYREQVLSCNVPCGNLRQPAEVQKLMHRLNGLPIGPALKIGFLKSLMRARYAVEPLGHYGLAKAKYTHFTSPIRRYADLVVHRALFDRVRAAVSALQATAEHISITERNSADAERDSKDVKLFAFLNAQLKSGRPEPYPALVTDVRNFGFFVDVPGLAMSGLVPLSSVDDDFYLFDATRSQLVGRRTRRVIRLGDAVTVQVAKVESFKKQVDFRLVDDRPARDRRMPARAGSRPAAASSTRPARPQARSGDRPRTDRPAPRQRQGGPIGGQPRRSPAATPQRSPGRVSRGTAPAAPAAPAAKPSGRAAGPDRNQAPRPQRPRGGSRPPRRGGGNRPNPPANPRQGRG